MAEAEDPVILIDEFNKQSLKLNYFEECMYVIVIFPLTIIFLFFLTVNERQLWSEKEQLVQHSLLILLLMTVFVKIKSIQVAVVDVILVGEELLRVKPKSAKQDNIFFECVDFFIMSALKSPIIIIGTLLKSILHKKS